MNFLPMPHHVVYDTGCFCLTYQTAIILKDTKPSAMLYANMLKETIKLETGLTLPISRGQAREGSIVLAADDALAADTYHLNVEACGVIIRGGSDQAICYGVQTLGQWVKRNGTALPCLQIIDHPDLANRGYYLDVSRGRIPKLDTLKKYADLLCQYKINQWQLYVEHTYLFHDLSEAWRDDTPLTAEEIMELDAYCNARCIELVPSLSTFGHMYKILSTKTFSHLCELEDSEKIPFSYTYAGEHHTLNVSNQHALDFIKGLIDEYMALFTSKKFNICADETFDLGKQRSKALKEEVGEKYIYINHVKALCEFLVEKGHTPMFWGDIMWRHADVYNLLPKETICLNWGYMPKQREHEIALLASMGATQYACPGVCSWNRWIPLVEDSFSNIQIMSNHGRKHKAIGLLNTDWGDEGHICHPWFTIPGILYGAAFAWNADEIDFDEVNKAISFLQFGDASENFMEGFVKLSCNEVFPWGDVVRWIEEADATKRKERFSQIDLAKVPPAQAKIDDALQALGKAARTMPPEKRDIIQALSIVADGIKTWNNIALHLGQSIYGVDLPCQDGNQLAEGLEKWYFAYLQLWRTVSKESSVSRTLNIVMKYADLLRGREYPCSRGLCPLEPHQRDLSL